MPTPNDVTVHLKATDDATWKLNAAASAGCDICSEYRRRRASTIAVWSVIYGDRYGVAPLPLALRYMGSVHALHLGGGCLSTRPSTPPRKIDGTTRITVHRHCNGCNADMGDATPAEVSVAVNDEYLPDVRLECGCLGREVQAA